jgi:Glyoxalase-like domain
LADSSAIACTDLAGNLQTAARELGATADPGLPRFAQLFLDAADVDAVRAFWAAALGYTHDRRTWNTDIYDPRRLNPVLVFQELDASETERRPPTAQPRDVARHDRNAAR